MKKASYSVEELAELLNETLKIHLEYKKDLLEIRKYRRKVEKETLQQKNKLLSLNVV